MEIRALSSNVWGWLCIANRDDLLAEIYLEALPDTVGLQEVSNMIRTEEKSLFDLCEPEYRELEVMHSGINYTPIMYRNTLKVIDCGWELFEGKNDVDSKSITYGIFEKEGKRFVHVNVHFYWENNFIGADARISNVHQLEKTLRKFGDLPIVITGDFNCEERTLPIQMMLNSGLYLTSRLNKTNIKSHHLKPKFDEVKKEFCGGTLLGGRNASIDHIFTKNCTAKRFVTISTQKALDASDHCPVYADIEI